ncbi:MAG: hypothetical protein ABIK65_12205 [Candidatus Eisenbacteria bacterium]
MRNPNLFLLVLGLVGLLAGCVGEENPTGPERALAPPRPVVLPLGAGSLCGDPITVPLIAGRQIDAGSVTVALEANEMRVEIATSGEWVLHGTQVAVGPNLRAIPQTRTGRPKIGKFPLKAEHDPPVTTYTYLFDAAQFRLGPGDAYMAVHADLAFRGGQGAPIAEEGAWAEGLRFPGGGWAMYFLYPLDRCEETGDCGLLLSAPDGGETLCADFPAMITWTASDCGDSVAIELLRDGVPCGTVAESAPNTGEYEWIAASCDEAAGPYRIRIRDLLSGVEDQSEGDFEIVPCGGGEKR